MQNKIIRYIHANRSTLRVLVCTNLVLLSMLFTCCNKSENAHGENAIEYDYELYVPAQTEAIIGKQDAYSYEYDLLHRFFENKMLDGYAVHTHYLPSNAKKNYATGYDVLSESQGLLMDIALNEQNEAVYEGAFLFIEQYMLTDKGIGYRYSDDGVLDEVNAAVDDLRIIGALLRSEDIFDDRYYNIAVEYSNSFLETNIVDGYIVDYFEQKNEMQADFITLCYLDFDTLGRLANMNEEYNKIYEKMLLVVEGGYIGDDLPLYQTRYSYNKRSYETQRINMIECVLTMMHLAEVDRLQSKSIEYIKGLINEGVVYSTYASNGTKNTNEESTAVYGLIALLAKTINDKQLYDSSIKLMQQLQVMDETSEVYGGYANAESLQSFSFDNLLALLAYSEGYTYD